MSTIPGTTAFTSDTNVSANTHRASGMPEVGGDAGKLAVATTNIEVWSNGAKIGFIQSLTPSEQRNIIRVQELGTEGVVQSVPSNTQGGQVNINRFALYNSNLYNALGLTHTGRHQERNNQIAGSASSRSTVTGTYGNPFRTLKDQRVPLEIQVKTKIPSNTERLYVETYIDCWLSSYTKTIASDRITITEQATIQYSDVYAAYTSN